MAYIITYTEKHIDPVNPDIDKVDIEDIAHALSLTCRGNGHVKHFFSVGQHCIYCCEEALKRGYGRRVALACLLHDATECYLSDVPRPFKAFMPDYVAAENKLLMQIYIKYLGQPLTEEELKRMKEIDDDLLYYDMEELLGEKQPGEKPKLSIRIDKGVVPFETIEKRYLELFEECSSI